MSALDRVIDGSSGSARVPARCAATRFGASWPVDSTRRTHGSSSATKPGHAIELLGAKKYSDYFELCHQTSCTRLHRLITEHLAP